MIHLIPFADVKDHIESIHCPCNPTTEKDEDGELVVIHNAFDGSDKEDIMNLGLYLRKEQLN